MFKVQSLVNHDYPWNFGLRLHRPASPRVPEPVAVFAPETASSGCLKSCSGKPNFTKARSVFEARNENNQVNNPFFKTKNNNKLDRTTVRYKYLLRAPQKSTSLGNVGFRHKEIAGFQPQLVALPTSSEHSLNLESQTRRFCLIHLRKMTINLKQQRGKKRGFFALHLWP